MHGTLLRMIPAWARFFVLLTALAACLRPGQARADAFPDTVYFDGFEACGLQCARVQCPGNGTTSLSGTIYAPEGTIPLPNVEVYIANATVGPLVDGPPSLRCDQAPSGHPLVATLTGSDGKFRLVNVPVGTPMNLVVLAGKWRRQVPVPALSACVDTPVDPVTTRLPRNHNEGDIAHIAVATGSADAFECLIRKIGVADSEFSTSSGSGRIDLFSGTSGSATNHFDLANGGATFAAASTLWASSVALAAYDQVMLACDGSQNPGNTIPAAALQAMTDYANAGGRVYLAHWQNYWLQASGTWGSLATWNNGLASFMSPITAQVSNDFAQAATEYAWLTLVGASSTPGMLSIQGGRQTAISIDANVARKWLYLDTTSNGAASVQYFSFTTPIEAAPSSQLGRVGFTDIHDYVGDTSNSSAAFPSGGCTTALTSLTPQEKALIYATFDLQRCVGSTRE